MRRMSQALSWITLALAAVALAAGPAHAQKKTLVVALNQDPDILDPTLARGLRGSPGRRRSRLAAINSSSTWPLSAC